MNEHRGTVRQAPPAPVDARLWRSTWTRWPGSLEPLLLLASPGRSYRGGSGFAADQADSWYCSSSLRMIDWRGEHAIPTLSALSVNVGGPRLRLLVAGRPWLEPVPENGSSGRDCERAAFYERTVVGVLFTASRPTPTPLDFPTLHRGLLDGTALVGDAPVTTAGTRA